MTHGRVFENSVSTLHLDWQKLNFRISSSRLSQRGKEAPRSLKILKIEIQAKSIPRSSLWQVYKKIDLQVTPEIHLLPIKYSKFKWNHIKQWETRNYLIRTYIKPRPYRSAIGTQYNILQHNLIIPRINLALIIIEMNKENNNNITVHERKNFTSWNQ